MNLGEITLWPQYSVIGVITEAYPWCGNDREAVINSGLGLGQGMGKVKMERKRFTKSQFINKVLKNEE